MKRILLLTAAALLVTSAQAQLLRPQSIHAPAKPYPQAIKPKAKKEVAQMRTPGTPVQQAPNKAQNIFMWYRRPAGAFPASIVVEDGAYTGMLYAPYLAVTPYTYYTFKAYANGQSENATYEWDVQDVIVNDDGEEEEVWETFPGSGQSGMDLTYKWGLGIFEMPVFYVIFDNDFYMWTMCGYEMGGTSDKPIIVAEHPCYILSVPSTMEIWNVDILKSSKNFCYGGRNGDKLYPMTYYSGAEPYGDNEDGFWFGKNAGSGNYRIDGIAQAYEKPTAPYLLNQVVLDCTELEVAEGAQVDMTCKIYKLDEIPPYLDGEEALLPEEPGELIAKGRATIDSETDATTGGLIYFTLYGEEDGLEYDITPTIDCAILVVIDGYNDSEMDDLKNFSALISSDWNVDEGFGELAYLKFGIPDEEGNLDHYVWAGLNNFFSGPMEMKTGLTIFLSTENPFLVLNNDDYGGQYEFPSEGGRMENPIGDHTRPSIEFMSWEPSADDAWYVTCNGKDVPDWLTITLEDQIQDGEFTGMVFAEVTAEPLPRDVKYREAVVRFEYPGAYIDYKFIQGRAKPDQPPFNDGDVNFDGIVNVSDLNLVAEYIFSGYDFNISHINYIINIILDGMRPIMTRTE